MSSDSELSAAVADDNTLESALKDAVDTAFANGKQGELSINSVRSAVEQELDLDDGFFKSHEKWKSLSKSIIGEAVVGTSIVNSGLSITLSKAAAEQEPPKAAKKSKTGAAQKSSGGAKRKAKPVEKPEKRRKNNGRASAAADDSSDGEDDQVKVPAQKSNSSNDSDSSRLSEAPSDATGGRERSAEAQQAPDSESELSDVKDDGPPKKRRKSAGSKPGAKAASTKAKASKPAKDADLSPDEQEIKKLQGWLLKCGIRKLWHRELAPYDSNKAKIKHLKGMLDDVGMTGRYSVEKANSIKEQRELAADLEAVQEGNKHWGADSGSENGDNSDSAARPVRRNRNTSRFVDFGDDEDDE